MEDMDGSSELAQSFNEHEQDLNEQEQEQDLNEQEREQDLNEQEHEQGLNGHEHEHEQGLNEQEHEQGINEPEQNFNENQQHFNELEYEHDSQAVSGPAEAVPEYSPSEQKQEAEGNSVPGDIGAGEKWPGWPGESVFRMLVPAQKVGSIIGRKGEYIKKICEETKARIKILDGPPGTAERAVMVSAKEDPDASHPPAINGLLEVHRRIVDGLESDSSHAPPNAGGKVSTRLLVPSGQAGSLIGRQGATVKSIQDASNSIVRVLGTEELPAFALQDDRVVETVGEPGNVHKAIELIASQLRKFLVDRSIIPIIEREMQMPSSQMEHLRPPQSWGPSPHAFPPNNSGAMGYGADPHFMRPRRHHDMYHPPAEMPPPLEKQPHQGISAYGREPPTTILASPNQPSSSLITQVTQHMQVPLSYADAVIGSGGATISYIRRVSGATVTIQESRGAPGEMTVEITGTASQVQTAQQLIQNSMAEAAGSQDGVQSEQGYNPYAAAQGSVPGEQGYNPYPAGPVSNEQGYNPYAAARGPTPSEQSYNPYAAAQGPAFSSDPSSTGLPAQHGGYGSVYGTNYGY